MPASSLFSNPFEQASASLGNLLNVDPYAAARSAFSVDTLSPAERQSAVDRYLGDSPGPLKSILNVLTNPLVLVGLVLTMKYPIRHAGRLLAFEGKIGGYARKHFPGMLWLNDFGKTFDGTPLPAWFERAVKVHHTQMETNIGAISSAFDRSAKIGYRYTKESGTRMAVYLDDLANPKHRVWQQLRDNLPEGAALGALGRGALVRAPKLTSQEKNLADSLSTFMRSQYTAITNIMGEAGPARISQGLQRVGIQAGVGKELPHYFPHVQVLDRAALKARGDKYIADLLGDVSDTTGVARTIGSTRYVREAATLAKTGKMTSPAFAARRGLMVPLVSDLEAAGLATPELRRVIAAAESHGGKAFKTYSFDLPRVLEDYTRGMARTHAWEVPPAPLPGQAKSLLSTHEFLQRELPKIAAAGKIGAVKANMLRETYIPLASGQMQWEQSVASLKFGAIKEQAVSLLERMPIPSKTKDFLMRPLLEGSTFTSARISSGIQNFLYSTTLGLNVVSPMKNLLQNVLTTYPMIGVKYTGVGMKRTADGAREFFKLRFSGVSSQDAMRRVWPEFAEAQFDIGGKGLGRVVDAGAASDPVLRLSGPGLGESWEKFQRRALTLFTGSEKFNRISAFYGARAKAIAELPGKLYKDPFTGIEVTLSRAHPEELGVVADRFADTIARMTQFGGGPLAAPYGLLKGTFSHPLVRQYMQFPLRVGGFGANALERGVMGIIEKGADIDQLGTVGRMMLGSGVVYGIGKEVFDTDLSNALLFGALPQMGDSSQPFGILPLVSPALQIGGRVAAGVIGGDLDQIKKALPLMVPGGIQLARMTTAAAPPVAEWLGRSYADYDTPTPDGRIPVYSGKGSLQGYYSPTQLWARAVGLGDVSGTQELALMKYMLSQRERIRDYRRKFIEARTAQNLPLANSIESEYMKKYPGMGGIEVRKSDLRSVQLRQEVPRLERIMETLPAHLRPIFAQLIAASFGAAGPSFFGTDPAAFGTGTIRSRMPNRPLRAVNPGIGLPDGTTMGSAQAARQAGMTRRDDLSTRGFNALKGYL